MNKDLGKYRKSYDRSELNKSSVNKDPLIQFGQWFNEVDKAFPEIETNAMTLSTLDNDGFPRGRVVLLKEITDNGVIFYTNYNSQKGQAIGNYNKICLSFFWPDAERQVIIKGTAHKVSSEKSDSYFKSRPKGSQLGAVASEQSEIIPDKQYLNRKLEELKSKYETSDVPRPIDWGGYLVIPIEFEFWQGRPNRLHDRICYRKDTNEGWSIVRLSP